MLDCQVILNVEVDVFEDKKALVGLEVSAMFHHDLDYSCDGIIVRYDEKNPAKTIIHLNDGRYVLGNECHYSLRIDQSIGRKNE